MLAIGGLSLGGQILLEIAARRNKISRFFLFESTLAIPMRITAAFIPSSVSISYPLIRMLLENAAFMPSPSIKETNALVIVGSEERRIMRRSARKLNEIIEGSKLRILPGYKHGELSLRQPEEYVALLVKMIDGKR